MATQIKLRRDTAANWYSANPTLGQGEPGYDLTSKKLKIGDGVTAWRTLDWFDDQTTDLSAHGASIVPSTDNTYNLGSPTKRWGHLYVANSSIYIGDIKLSTNNGTLVVQQVTDAGLNTEAPVPNAPGVVTTDRIVHSDHSLVLTSAGELELDGQTFTGGSSDRLVNGLKEVVLNTDGSLTLPIQTVGGWDWNNAVTQPTLQLGVNTDNVAISDAEKDETYRGNTWIKIQGQKGYGTSSTSSAGGKGTSVGIFAGTGGESSEPNQGGEGGFVDIHAGTGQHGANGGWINIQGGHASWSNTTDPAPNTVFAGGVYISGGNANEQLANGTGFGGEINIQGGTGNAVNGRVHIQTFRPSNDWWNYWDFATNGSFKLPGAYGNGNDYQLDATQLVTVNSGSTPTVVFTSVNPEVQSIKATITVFCVQAPDQNADTTYDTQICEMLITTKYVHLDNGGATIKTAIATVYGVTHTSTNPLATFTVNLIQSTVLGTPDVIQILAEPTASVTGTNMQVTTIATEIANYF